MFFRKCERGKKLLWGKVLKWIPESDTAGFDMIQI